jgi:hypothetical protein
MSIVFGSGKFRHEAHFDSTFPRRRIFYFSQAKSTPFLISLIETGSSPKNHNIASWAKEIINTDSIKEQRVRSPSRENAFFNPFSDTHANPAGCAMPLARG